MNLSLTQLFVQAFSNGVVSSLLLGPLALIILDVLTGIASAVHRGTFQFKRLTDFLQGDLLKYIGAFLFVLLVWAFHGSVQATTTASIMGMAPLAVSILASIAENIKELFPPSIQPFITPLLSETEQLLHLPTPMSTTAPPPHPASGTSSVNPFPQQVSANTGIPNTGYPMTSTIQGTFQGSLPPVPSPAPLPPAPPVPPLAPPPQPIQPVDMISTQSVLPAMPSGL